MDDIFKFLEFIPEKVKVEFIKRWAIVPKISFEEFFISANKSNNNGDRWWDMNSTLKAYERYKEGCINVRYPTIPCTPSEILNKIISDVNKMINF